MKSYSDEDLFGDTRRYDAVLSPLSKALATRTARDLAKGTLSPAPVTARPASQGPNTDTIDQLYEVAQELRDRLRFSELRMKQLKTELREAHTAVAAERKAAAAKLAQAEHELQTERSIAESQMMQLREEAAGNLQRERSQAMSALEALEGEVQQLSTTVKSQAADIANLESQNKDLKEATAQYKEQLAEQTDHFNAEMQAEAERHDRQLQREAAAYQEQLEEARGQLEEGMRQLADAVAQAEAATAQAEAAVQSRSTFAQQAADLKAQLDDAHHQLAEQEAAKQEVSNALLDAKAQMAEASQVAALYQSAKEELERLDKENVELKEMVQGEVFNLTRSRILDSVGPEGQRRHQKSTPLFLTPEATGKRPGSARRRRSRSLSPLRDQERLLASTGVVFPPDLASELRQTTHGGAVYRPPALGASALAEAAQLASLSFLGPPSSAYHTDPDKFVFVRVAGGFSPKYVGQEPLPKASGWIPKAVVRLVQAFRHSYGLAGDPQVPWMCWEPLLLMVDEVYRRVAAAADVKGPAAAPLPFPLPTPGLGRSAAAARDRQRSPGRPVAGAASVGPGVGSVATFPSVVQAERIVQLRKQLDKATKKTGRAGRVARRKGGGDWEDVDDHVLVRRMAEKDYHAANQLAESEHENMKLRQKYSLVSGGAGDYRDRAVGDQLVGDVERERRRLKDTMSLLSGALYDAGRA